MKGDIMNDLIIRQLPVGPLEANAYLVWREGRDDAFIIDPGDDFEALQQAIALSGKQLTDILLTHGHFDHVLSAAALAKAHSAKIHIHPYDAHMLLTAGASLYNPSWCRMEFTPVQADAPFPVEPGPWEIEICGVCFEGFMTPGHTPGSICLLDKEHDALFTGDTIFAYSYGRTDFPGGSDEEMCASLNRLLAMDGKLTVWSGHGEADTMAAIARRWRR